MFFNVDNIEVIKTIKKNIESKIYLSDEFYTGINLSIHLDDLDVDMFGCWNSNCEDKISISNSGMQLVA